MGWRMRRSFPVLQSFIQNWPWSLHTVWREPWSEPWKSSGPYFPAFLHHYWGKCKGHPLGQWSLHHKGYNFYIISWSMQQFHLSKCHLLLFYNFELQKPLSIMLEWGFFHREQSVCRGKPCLCSNSCCWEFGQIQLGMLTQNTQPHIFALMRRLLLRTITDLKLQWFAMDFWEMVRNFWCVQKKGYTYSRKS